ncbi:MAG: tryptophanase [candidate division Zixibacteria bacterium]|nr:tryptophanase [candidate division Zixibacteria bacterium]
MNPSAHPIEPFRIKAIEPIHALSRSEREKRLSDSGFNLFNIRAEDVYIDLLTDSGTGAMSDRQWAGLLRGDESYAGSRNFVHLEKTVRELTGYPYVIPTHQGRAAEHLLFSALLDPGDYVVSNSHFDTTRANVMGRGAFPIDLPDPHCADVDDSYPFKGDIDLEALARVLDQHRDRVKCCLLTITNNTVGGHPLSLANAQAARRIVADYGVPLYFDAARFAENAWFLSQREESQKGKAITAIVRTMFEIGDGCMVSAKKDGLASIGGFLAFRDAELVRRLKELMVIVEGFPTYGGLAGRDIEAMTLGLEEVTDPAYLSYRVGQVNWLGEQLAAAGARIVRPVGGHAVFIDAGALYPHIEPDSFPGQALAVAFYREGGVRTVEIGSLMFGGADPETGAPSHPAHELVRLAIPRRVYTVSHLNHVVETFAAIFRRRHEARGFEVEYQVPQLRHFTARLREAAPRSVVQPI